MADRAVERREPGRARDLEGLIGQGLRLGGGTLAGSAIAGGATPIATQNPMTVADAIEIDEIRGRGDMSHLSKGGRRIDVSS